MPSLYALLVAINNYPDPRHTLRGCVNDMLQMQQYLKDYCEQAGIVFLPLVLTDEAATRQGVINGFDHYQSAETSDCCLFYFAGHGSRCPAPEAFWGLEADDLLESIVCWDSRKPGCNDLMDKELSYLIWRATQGKDAPFLTIMDCCHSGRMRDAKEEEIGLRTLRESYDTLPAAQFTGIEYYKKMTDGQLRPPLGRRVHLAAARDTETAKEVNAGGQPHGIFTYCLIEALNATGPLISYADLMNRVNLRIRNAVADQSAQLDATFTEDRNRGFLFSQLDALRPSYLVAWDKELNSWMINAGALHGIPEGDSESRTLLELTSNGHQVSIEHVLPNRSKVSGMEGYDSRRSYAATIKRRAIPKLDLAFAPGSDPEGINLLRSLIADQASDLFRLQEEIIGSAFLIHAKDNTYFLSRTHHAEPLFQRVPGYNIEGADFFVKQLDKVANWQQVLDLQHPGTGIRDSEIGIELYRVTEPGNEEDTAPVEVIDWQATLSLFSYIFDKGQWHRPAFQLKICNNGLRPLWVGLLYLGSDFSIDNQLLTKEMLAPGQEVWAQEIFNGYAYRTISLHIQDNQLRKGINRIDEYLKLFISTEELNTDVYCQKGLDANRTKMPNLVFKRRQPVERDWATKVMWFRVERLV